MIYMIGGSAIAASMLLGVASPAILTRGRLAAIGVSIVLLLVVYRALLSALFGVRPTSLLVVALLGVLAGLAIGARSIRALAMVAVVLLLALVTLSFRSSDLTDLRASALTLVIPAFILGAVSPVRESTLRVALYCGGAVMVVLILLSGTYADGRLSIPDENPIWTARALVLAGIALLWESRVDMRIRILLVSGVGMLAFRTESRGPLWALLIVIVLYALSRVSKGWRPLVGAGLIPLAYLVIAGGSTASVAELGIERESSTSARFDLWARAWEVWRSSPFLGSGTPADDPASGLGTYPHNFLFEILAQSGLVGMALLVGIVVIGWRTVRGVSRSLLVATIVFAFVSGSIWASYELWVMLGVAVAGVLTKESALGPKYRDLQVVQREP